MKPVLYGCLAVVLYSAMNVVLEQKLIKYTPITLLFFFYVTMLPITIIWIVSVGVSGRSMIWPSGMTIVVTMAVGAVYFFADYCFVSAYTSGGKLMTVMTITMMFPVFASVTKFFWVGALPNNYQIISYLFAAVSIFLLTKGNS